LRVSRAARQIAVVDERVERQIEMRVDDEHVAALALFAGRIGCRDYRSARGAITLFA
jgi:hypothetical protein